MQIGWFNGWILMAILYVIFGILLIIFPREVVKRLYDRTGWTHRDYIGRLFGGAIMIAWFGHIILSPLKLGEPVFFIGLGVWTAGLLGFVMALFNYKNTPLDRPVSKGLYNYSRNPQVVMLYIGFLGTSIAIGSWLAIILLLVASPLMHTRILAEERACLAQYGETYREYMNSVPRYFLIL